MKISYLTEEFNRAKKLMSLLLSVGLIPLSACTGNLPVNNSLISQGQTFNVSQLKGASISIRINRGLNFSAKATANGTPAKTYQDIKSYIIYLIKSSTLVFPLTGDPLDPANIAFTVKVNTSGNSTDLITFSNVLASSGKFYHVAVRAFDGPLVSGEPSGNELIKDNNDSASAWTGTAALTPKVAVSAGDGIQVDIGITPSGTNTLEVTPNLLDMVGPTIDSNITVAGVSKNNVAYYKINFCFDSTRPLTTRVFDTPFQVSMGYGEYNTLFTHNFLFNNLIPGKYFATFQAFNSANTNLTAANNAGTAFASPDNGAQIAVTGSSVDVSSDYVLTFTPASPTRFDLTLNTQ
jgi:hypothetical protein